MSGDKTLVEQVTSTPEGMRLFQQEALLLEVSESICGLMEEKGISRSKLAELLGKSKSYITQALDGRTNLTLRTIADFFTALDSAARISVVPLVETVMTVEQPQSTVQVFWSVPHDIGHWTMPLKSDLLLVAQEPEQELAA